MSQSTTWAPSAPAPPAPGKHEGPNTPKYMKAKIKEVALKDESIVLSWPLVSYAERRNLKYPLLYFDVAFDPREPINVKDNRAMHFLPLPPEDRELPVSTHCKVTEIIIDCPHVGSLIVERPEGLRCIDVFYAIYCKYQKKPRPHEMPADRAKYQPAFEQRCKDSPGISDVNLKKTGFLRVDLLKGKRIFDGLKRSNGRWVLVINS
ncbi:hypothetical protein B0H14DRAFT_1262450 [Mycena olivaceomarginata]|nr:hypothetical protein B0H14DRAFT_1262450 [Mycena olivaceomarginata]